jgi:hypothetical protein
MVGRNTAVSGIYRLKDLAERALDTLIAGAIPCSSISVVLLLASAVPKGAGADKDTDVIGGTIGILAGVGTVAVPGLGQVIGAGPIMAGLATACRGPQPNGADGGLIRALTGIGIPEREAERCEAYIRNGGTLLSVSCSSAEQASRVRNLLAGTGAIETRRDAAEPRVGGRLLGGL